MSVLINGMEMPTSCDVCRFAIDGFCYASGKVNVSAVEERQVTNYCPLVPVPPHGRLISANLLKADFTGNFIEAYPTALVHAMIDDAPTIVPADRGAE